MHFQCIYSPAALLEAGISSWAVQWVFDEDTLAVWDNGTVALDNQGSGLSLMLFLTFSSSSGNSSLVLKHPSSVPPTEVRCIVATDIGQLSSSPVAVAVVQPGKLFCTCCQVLSLLAAFFFFLRTKTPSFTISEAILIFLRRCSYGWAFLLVLSCIDHCLVPCAKYSCWSTPVFDRLYVPWHVMMMLVANVAGVYGLIALGGVLILDHKVHFFFLRGYSCKGVVVEQHKLEGRRFNSQSGYNWFYQFLSRIPCLVLFCSLFFQLRQLSASNLARYSLRMRRWRWSAPMVLKNCELLESRHGLQCFTSTPPLPLLLTGVYSMVKIVSLPLECWGLQLWLQTSLSSLCLFFRAQTPHLHTVIFVCRLCMISLGAQPANHLLSLLLQVCDGVRRS